MRRDRMKHEDVEFVDDAEQCPECGHIWTDYEQGHYHDCRYFTLTDEGDEVFDAEVDVKSSQLSMFRPAA